MNTQKIFDTVATHLLTQKVKSVGFSLDGTPGCMYRGVNGTRCAVGCLIPDEMYSDGIEHLMVKDAEIYEILWEANVLSEEDQVTELELLANLQAVHDGYPETEWADELNRVCREFHLNPTTLYLLLGGAKL